MKKIITFYLIYLLTAQLKIACAQNTAAPLTSYETAIQAAIAAVKKAPFKASVPGEDPNFGPCSDPAGEIVNIECRNTHGFLLYIAGGATFSSLYHSFLQSAEETVGNHPAESTTSSAGSTGLVTKAAVPEVIGLAVSGGALTQSTSGTTSTFTGNARGLYRYLTGKEVFPYCPNALRCDSLLSGAMRRLSASISLDNANSSNASAPTSGTTSSPSASTSPVALSGSSWRMSAWGVQYQLPLGKADPNKGAAFQKAWDNQMTQITKSSGSAPIVLAAKQLDISYAVALDTIEKSDEYKAWQKTARSDIGTILKGPNPTVKELEDTLQRDLDQLVQIVVIQKKYITADQIQAALDATNEFFAARDNLIKTVDGTLPGLSLAYTNAHPLNEANVSNLKLIFQLQPKPGTISLTANVAADIYDALPAGSMVGRWRDLQVAGQADFTLPTKFGNPVFSLAGYYQYTATKAVLQIPAGNTAPGTNITLPGPAATLLAPAGNIWVAQALLTFPVKSSTTKIPIGISWANRTELLTGYVVRAHIGVNFDFDSLFMK